MLILFCVIGAVILGTGVFVCLKWGDTLARQDREWVYRTLNYVGGSVLALSLLFTIGVGVAYAPHITIDERIAMYRDENSQIEHQISVVVTNYMEYEADTFEKFKDEDCITLVNLFPELKANELVAKQIEVYVENNKTIKSLEYEKTQYKIYAWWLFFKS